jgi:uncharacterized membrane protein
MAGEGKLVVGIVVGAGAMYLLDPDRGARRRSLLRDRGVHAGHTIGRQVSAAARDTRNRTAGLSARFQDRFRRDEATDEVIEQRARAALGRAVSHPGAVTVTASQGIVTLTGQVLADEVSDLLLQMARVRGVNEVRNELEIHADADDVPSLQGAGRSRSDAAGSWPPVTRLLVGTAGVLLTAQGVRHGRASGAALGAAGIGLLARSMIRRPLLGSEVSAQPEQVEVTKTIAIGAPVDAVWDLWSNFESFPRFMGHLQEVRKIDQERSHWVARGPAGVPVEWDAVVTEWVPKQFIAWSSMEGSSVDTSGQVRFRRTSDAQTELDIHLRYAPPGGIVGHEVAALFGADPKRAMDDDLGRVKALLEEGQPTEEATPRQSEAPTTGPRRVRRRPGSKGKS